MPIAFTETQQQRIRQHLLLAAKTLVKEKSMKNITVDQLVKSAGISKGAFYKFFETKNHLFFCLLLEEHHKIFQSSISILRENFQKCAEERLYQAILAGADALNQSELNRFWSEDAPLVVKTQMPDFFKEMQSRMTDGIRVFIRSCPPLKVSERQAIRAIYGLIFTYRIRQVMGAEYAKTLQWMVHGVCASIFGTSPNVSKKEGFHV